MGAIVSVGVSGVSEATAAMFRGLLRVCCYAPSPTQPGGSILAPRMRRRRFKNVKLANNPEGLCFCRIQNETHIRTAGYDPSHAPTSCCLSGSMCVTLWPKQASFRWTSSSDLFLVGVKFPSYLMCLYVTISSHCNIKQVSVGSLKMYTQVLFFHLSPVFHASNSTFWKAWANCFLMSCILESWMTYSVFVSDWEDVCRVLEGQQGIIDECKVHLRSFLLLRWRWHLNVFNCVSAIMNCTSSTLVIKSHVQPTKEVMCICVTCLALVMWSTFWWAFLSLGAILSPYAGL